MIERSDQDITSKTDLWRAEALQNLAKIVTDMNLLNKAFKDREVMYRLEGEGNKQQKVALNFDEAIKLGVFNSDGSINKEICQNNQIQFSPERTQWLQHGTDIPHTDKRQLLLTEAVCWVATGTVINKIGQIKSEIAREQEVLLPPEADKPSNPERYDELMAKTAAINKMISQLQTNFLENISNVGFDINHQRVTPRKGFLQSINEKSFSILQGNLLNNDPEQTSNLISGITQEQDKLKLLDRINESYKMIEPKSSSFLGKKHHHYTDEQKSQIKVLQNAFLATLKSFEPENRLQSNIQAIFAEKKGIAHSGSWASEFTRDLDSLRNAAKKLTKEGSKP